MDYPRVGVALILEKDGKVLLVRRKGAHGAGTWSTPGGHLEFGESPETCAIRETKEEIGVTASEPKFVALTNDVFEKEGRHYITIWMRSYNFTGLPFSAATEEVAELGWFQWDTLPSPLFLPLENLLRHNSYPAAISTSQPG
jgi:8-oxo-dGTP diphosphatase